MDILIALLVLIPVIILILLIAINSRTSSHQEYLESIERELKKLGEQVKTLTKQLSEEKTQQKILPERQVTPIPPTKEPVQEIKPQPEKEVYKIPEVQQQAAISQTSTTKDFTQPPERRDMPVHAPEQSWWGKWMQNNPDLEKFIGENLANKIGIAVLVLGIGFFVKYAIDKDWIPEVGRVVIGLVCGGILIGIAHRTRNSYRSFSSVLVGGGLTVLYFTIAFAFHQYHLIGQKAAFAIMTLITAFAVTLSLLYNRLEVAILATIGGFVTPFLVTTGQDNYVVLFTYMCILNTGLIVLSWFKRWPSINFIALSFTVFIFGGWLVRRLLLSEEVFPYKAAMFFASIFYALFIVMNILNNLRAKRTFGAFDFMIVLSVNFLYYTAGMFILQYWNNGAYKGLFTAMLGGINLVLAWIFFKRNTVDKNFIYLLIGLTLTFISLAAPVQLKGNHITLFWAAEAVVLFWLFQRSRIVLIKIASLLILILMFGSLLLDWVNIYFSDIDQPILFNKGFITNIIAATALFIYYFLMKKEADSYYLRTLTNKSVRQILLFAAVMIVYLAGVLEIWYQFNHHYEETGIYSIYLQLYSFLFAIILLYVLKRPGIQLQFRLLITILCFVLYLVNLAQQYDTSIQMLETGNNKIHFTVHWISNLLLLKLLYDLVLQFRKNAATLRDYEAPFTWITTIAIILFFSIEMYYVMLWLKYTSEDDWKYWENLYYKAGLSILWGLSSFFIMWAGMKFKFKTLRIISLTLFTITLAKLFAFDIRNIPAGGKIAAFILLGVLLLTISFMYQRLKKIIIDDSLEEK